jgi:type IV pilus assembly protein PilP
MIRTLRTALVLLCVSGVVSCDDETVADTSSKPAKKRAKRKPVEEEVQAPLPEIDFQETDFAETERSRDPFRSYADLFAEQARERVRSQRQVVLDRYSIEELLLIGIVTRIQPRAMLRDPQGKGHVVAPGQFIGRAERVQAGLTGAEYEVNWRVDRIRSTDIVLVREDPSHPDVPTATKVIPLRPDEDVD